MSDPFSATDLATLFLLERRNQRLLFDRAQWTSQERRSTFRLGITFAFCLGVLVVLLANHRDTLQLLSRGHSDTAVLVAKRINAGSNSYYLSYEFTAGRTQRIKVEKKTNASVFQASSIGEVVPVLYEPGKPDHCLVGEQIGASAKDKRVLLGWTLVSVIVLAFLLVAFIGDRQLRTGGVILRGSLVTVKFLSGGAEDPDKVEVHYEFASPIGNKLRAESKGIARRSNFSDLSRFILDHEAVAVAVLYLSDRRFALL